MGKLEPKKWYDITKKPDYDKMVAAIKQFIDNGEPFLFSNDYRMIRVDIEPVKKIPVWHKEVELPPGYKVEEVKRGAQVEITIKGRTIIIEAPHHFIITKNEKIIAIEV